MGESAFRVEDNAAERTATLRFTRPDDGNRLSLREIAAVGQTIRELGTRRGVKLVILQGDGEDFCLGRAPGPAGEAPKSAIEIRNSITQPILEVYENIRATPVPVLAMVQGRASGFGCALVGQCDLAIAADTAKFATPGVTWGFFCSTPGVAVGRNISRKRALEMLLTGEQIDARTALDWGMVNRVVAAAALERETEKLARAIAEKPPVQTAAGKRAFYQQLDLGAAKAYELASGVISASFAHDEGRAGMDAFLGKRPPPKH